MFEDYQYHKQISFSNSLQRLAKAQNGTLLTQTQNQIYITHTKGCDNPIELITYIKSELQMAGSITCYGVSTIALESREQSKCCFGLILNSSFWLIAVSTITKKQGSVQLELERVKLMKFTQNEQVSSVLFINLPDKNRVMIEQRMINGSVNVIDIQSYDRLTGNFKYHKLKDLKLDRRNQEQFGKWLWLRRNNILYSLFAGQNEDKLVITHQLTRSQTQDIKIFIYSLTPNAENQTYAQNILVLPTFQYETTLVDVLFVPTSEKPNIESSQLLLFYQRDTGLEIVQTNYHAPNVVIRKHLYQDLIYLQLIGSSIIPEEIYLKGIEFCLQNHTILLQTCKGIAQNHELTLLSLPSTASPQVINQKQINQEFYVCKNGKDGIWVYSSKSLFQIKITKKPKIYETLLKLQYPREINHLRAIINEVLQFLE